jgi:ribonuclease R
VYRIHEDPEPDALAAIATILSEFDYPIKDVGAATPRTFQKLIAFAANRPERLLINSLLLRAMKRARYVDYLDSHFGLASDAYCHFTSPIRRYPDLIVHRLLKAQLAGTLEDGRTAAMVAELTELAEHSSVMERESESAENESVKVKLTELMAAHIGEVFPGIISGVTSHGAYVQLDNTAEGLVHVMRMADDYYRFEAERFMLVGERSGRTWRLGQEVQVRITDAIPSDRRIEMEWA